MLGGQNDGCRAMLLRILEARVGIEPTHKGFADLSLTTWVPRLGWAIEIPPCWIVGEVYRRQDFIWSGRPGSNRRHLPWQGSTLPLSYSRSTGSSIAAMFSMVNALSCGVITAILFSE